MILSSQINKFWFKIRVKIFTFLVRGQFAKLESGLDPKVDFTNPEFISIGKGTSIRPYSWIFAIKGDKSGNKFSPLLSIGNHCSIGRFCHITCSQEVVIEDSVFLTEGVLITDSIHGYKEVNTPVIDQPLISKGPLRIGAGTWIGNGARIVGKVQIGKNCVIAANTLLSNTVIPDFSVVSGVPGKIVKSYDQIRKEWVNIH